jgi:hypothetical protein
VGAWVLHDKDIVIVSKGKGDIFVVESAGYDDRAWIDHFGSPTTTKPLEINMTLTDPKAHTEPWVQEICAPSEENHFNDRIRDAAVGKSKP